MKSNDTRRRARLQQTRKEIREVQDQLRMLGRELDDLRKIEAILSHERKRRAPQRQPTKKAPLHKTRKQRTKGTKKRGKKPLNGDGSSITTRGKLEDLFAHKEVLTLSQAEKELGMTTLRYHFSNLRDDRLIVEAGLAAPPKGGGKAEVRWRWVGPPSRELSIAAGTGTRLGRKKVAAP